MADKPMMTFEDSVKAKLKSIVADLIPEERFDALVSDAVQQFQTVELPKLVKDELAAKYKLLIAAEFNKPEWRTIFDAESNSFVSDAVTALLVQSAPLILASMMKGAAQNVVNQFQQFVGSNRGY